MLAPPTEARSNPELETVLAAYLQAEESGQALDRHEWLVRYPELADELTAFFDSRDVVPRLWPDRPLLQTPCRFGDYELLEEIAHGGMGIVYRAQQLRPNRIVALKLILSGQLARRSDVERFHAEAEAAASLDHPHIVPIYEVGQHAGQHYFTMKLIDGGSLAEHLRRECLPCRSGSNKNAPACLPVSTPHSALHNPQCSARLLATISRAIHYAHQRGILHRDLKPANILLQRSEVGSQRCEGTKSSDRETDLRPLTSDLVPYITDFGLAKQVTGDDASTLSGSIVGTAAYMAPEQAAGCKSLTTAADIYSLGAILYELLTGRPPFKADSALETLQHLRDREPASPRSLNPQIDRDLETICLKCLEKDPSRRYGSAEALADDLDRYLIGEPISARPVSPLEHTWRRCRRNPLTSSLIAAVVLIAALGLAGIVNQWQVALTNEKKAQTQRDEAQRQGNELRNLNDKLQRTLYIADINLAKHAWDQGSSERTLELLDRHRPQPGQFDLRGFEWRYLHRLCHSYLLTINVPISGINCVAFSPNGKRLAGALGNGTVMVWDAFTGRALLTLKGHQQPVWSVAFSSDGTLLAGGSGCYGSMRKAGVPGEVKMWEAQTGKELLSLRDAGHVFCVAFSPDGRRLASGADDATRLWDARSGELFLSITEAAEPNGRGCLAFSPDGRRLVTSGGGRSLQDGSRLKVWDAESGQELLDLQGHTSNIFSVAISPDGRRLASASYDHTAKIWDLQTGQELQTLKGHALAVQAIAFSPDGQRVASGSLDGTIRLWDTQNGQELFAIKGRSGYVNSLTFSPEGKRLASSRDNDATVVATDVITEGKPAASARSPGVAAYVNVWEAEQRQECFTLHEQPSTDRGLAFSPSGERLLAAGGSIARLWDIQTRQEVLALDHAHLETGCYLYSGCFSPDGKKIATGGARGFVGGRPNGAVLKIWDAQAGSEVHNLQGHTDFIWDMAFSPDSRRLATASNDKTVKIWDTQTGREIRTFRGHNQPLWSVTFGPDGKRLASAGPKSNIKVWDTDTGDELSPVSSGLSAAYAVAFSPDGKRLVGASPDWTVRIWDARTGAEQLTLKGHVARVIKIVFSPDGKRLASASTDRTVKVWDVASGEELLTLSGHADYMLNVAFSPDGHRLASASADGAVKIWDATPLPANRSD